MRILPGGGGCGGPSRDGRTAGLIEFYLRWNNVVDQYGWSFLLEGAGVRPRTSERANETTSGTVKRKGCMKAEPPDCAGVETRVPAVRPLPAPRRLARPRAHGAKKSTT